MAETEQLGATLGEAAFAGAVLLLEGPLGAGKTALMRGVARGLGAAQTVTSPSFTILAVHRGRLPLFHLDLYRIADPGELRAIDLSEIFDSGGVTAVEWPRWLLTQPPCGTLEVEIHVTSLRERRFELCARDSRWKPLMGALGR